MINNDEDLLPLGSADIQLLLNHNSLSQSATAEHNTDQNSIYQSGPVPSAHDTPEDFGDFAARVAETFDSVDLLIAARAEAEEAEARAKAAGETPLPFAKKGYDQNSAKSRSAPDISAGTGGKLNSLFQSISSGGTGLDQDSPALLNMSGSDLAALSDASGVQTTLSARDFLDDTLAGADFDENASRMVVGGEVRELADVHIDELLRLTVESGASDLHLSVGLPPMVRKDGKLVPLPFEKANDRSTQRIIYDILNEEQITKFERTHELDFSHGVKGAGRFRFNVYRQRSSVGGAMRVIPNVVPSMEQLKLPTVCRSFTQKHSGLILVTGPTGSGKSTTIASMIDIINSEREAHILTIEDPIEYLHSHKKSMVNQRELGTDTDSFTNALRAALREDPDVILVGEMRDLETIAAAITLAETGHLVFATLHTRSAPATIDRIVDVFPAHQQEQIRIQLSTSIEAVVAQQLLPKIGGGRVAAIEIMVATSALRNLIREGKSYQIYSVIETGHQYGMQAMDRVLADLHRNGTVTFDEAASRAIDRENFQRLVKGY
jgi:twitching motility protein PilT